MSFARYPTCCPLVRFSHIMYKGASKMLRATGLVKPARLHFARTARALHASCPNFEPRAHARLTGLTIPEFVKPARLHFARTARALRDATYMYATYVCERGVLSEFRAARTCASYWFDNPRIILWHRHRYLPVPGKPFSC